MKHLIISLNNLILTGEKYLNNSYDKTSAADFLTNTRLIRKYIFDKYYHDAVLREYYKKLPDFSFENVDLISESYLEQLVSSSSRMNFIFESLGLSVAPKREKSRTKLASSITAVIKLTRQVLEKLDSEK